MQMSDDEIKILKRVISLKGIDHQLDICCEEFAELTQAIMKFKRYEGRLTDDSVCEECADALVCIQQLLIIFDDSKIQQIVKEKIERLKTRLDKDEML